MKTVLTVIGTRPEAIKLAPVLAAMSKNQRLKSQVCITWQHTHLLDPFLIALDIPITYQLEIHEQLHTLSLKAAQILKQFASILEAAQPDLVIVQGDTTTAFIAALAASYSQIPIAHVEAGLRTGSLTSPWPEEAHRCLIDRLTTFFFAPTEEARKTLLAEGTPHEKIWVVGNTSIDALRLMRAPSKKNSKNRNIVVTVHRRENQGKPLEAICSALRKIADEFSDVTILFFLHPNPAVRDPALKLLSGIPRIKLMDPTDHTSFVRIMDDSLFVMTDSGGIQEEAPFMGKPVVIVRDTTERPEGIEAGTARLVGTQSENIFTCCKDLLENPETLTRMSKVHFPYGDGFAAERIVEILDRNLYV